MSRIFNLHVKGTDVTVTVTDYPSAIECELYALKSSVIHTSKLVVGLGVEWNSADANAKPELLQLCIRTRCLVIRLQHVGTIPQVLKDFLADSKITFVSVGIKSAVAKLMDGYGLECANAVELSTLPAAKHITAAYTLRDPNVIDLAYDVCRVSISKATKLPCFYSPSSLPAHDEIVNAAKDAYAAYITGAKLLEACECKSLETAITVFV